ncbi:hypothetical protein BDB00DRAFT_942750 [Zychaea mexicana]|uniref:uncharacterized protein n=1 Tax=Zychaea mexicana TaxID=64656 RepID=UPI0022FDD294|nr:uncharacterized protein BDB00DRAFT_942750 [Zychaea mexicana]KAI9485011.1 hypothetical protein BDB00DRAFT_942750 [Zychaea mexicana]
MSLGTLYHQARYSSLSLVSEDLVQQRMRQRKAEISAATAAVVAAAKAAKKHTAASVASSSPPRSTIKNSKITSEHQSSPRTGAAKALGRDLIHRVDTRIIHAIIDRILSFENNDKSRHGDSNNDDYQGNSHNEDDAKTDVIVSPLAPNSLTSPLADDVFLKRAVEEKDQEGSYQPSLEPNYQGTDSEKPTTTLAERHLRRRQGAIQELLDTEVSYCKDLNSLVNHFFRGIADINSVPDRFKEGLFRNCSQILTFQTQFSETLVSAIQSEHCQDDQIDQRLMRIARQFCIWAEKFDVYIDYCIYQDKATDVHKELMSNNMAYQQTLDKLNKFKRSTDEMNGRRMFEDYMIMPVQRLLKYKLILESMSKTVPSDSAEHESLMMALNVMHEVALRLNSEKSRMEARRKTKLFLNRLDTDWVNSNAKVKAASRRFYGVLGSCVLIGTLDIRILSEGTKVKRFGCALFNSYMIIAKGKRHDRYEPRHWFPLRTFEVRELPNEQPSLPHSWLLFSETRSIEFGAMCETEKQIWLDKLRGAVKKSKDEYEESQTSSSAVEELFVSSFNLSSSASNNNSNITVATGGSAVPQPGSVHSYGSTSCTSLSSFFSRSELQVHSGSNVALDSSNNNRPDTPRTTYSVDTIDDGNSESPTHSSAQSSNVNSPGMRSQASISDFCDFVTNTVADFRSQRRYQQYSLRSINIDNKFEDVCTTPILTARSQAKNDRSSGMEQWKRKSRMGKSASMLAFTSIKGLEDEYHPPAHHPHHHSQPHHPHSKGPMPTATMSSPQDIFRSAVHRKASLPSRLRISEPITMNHDTFPRRPPSTHSMHSSVTATTASARETPSQQQHPPLGASGSVNTESMIFRLSRRGSLNSSNANESTTSFQSRSNAGVKMQVASNDPAARLPPQATPGLPRSLSAATMGLARTSSRFFGRMVEKLGTIGTPRRTRRNPANTDLRLTQSDAPYTPLATSSVPGYTADSSQKQARKTKRQLSKKPPPLIIPESSAHRTNSITRKGRSTERQLQK